MIAVGLGQPTAVGFHQGKFLQLAQIIADRAGGYAELSREHILSRPAVVVLASVLSQASITNLGAETDFGPTALGRRGRRRGSCRGLRIRSSFAHAIAC